MEVFLFWHLKKFTWASIANTYTPTVDSQHLKSLVDICLEIPNLKITKKSRIIVNNWLSQQQWKELADLLYEVYDFGCLKRSKRVIVREFLFCWYGVVYWPFIFIQNRPDQEKERYDSYDATFDDVSIHLDSTHSLQVSITRRGLPYERNGLCDAYSAQAQKNHLQFNVEYSYTKGPISEALLTPLDFMKIINYPVYIAEITPYCHSTRFDFKGECTVRYEPDLFIFIRYRYRTVFTFLCGRYYDKTSILKVFPKDIVKMIARFAYDDLKTWRGSLHI